MTGKGIPVNILLIQYWIIFWLAHPGLHGVSRLNGETS